MNKYQPIIGRIEQNPINEFYQELEETTNTRMPIICGHKKTLEQLCQRLTAIGEKVKDIFPEEENNVYEYVSALELSKWAAELSLNLYEKASETIEQFREEIKQKNPDYQENPKDQQDYLFFAKPLLVAVTNGKEMVMKDIQSLDNRINFVEQYRERCSEIREFANYAYLRVRKIVNESFQKTSHSKFQRDFSMIKETPVLSPDLIENLRTTLQNMKHNWNQMKKDFPDNIDYQETLTLALSALKDEYAEFRSDSKKYCQSREERIMGEIRAVTKGIEPMEPNSNVPLGTLLM